MRRFVLPVAAVVAVLIVIGQSMGAVLFEDNFDDGTYTDNWVTYNGNSFDAATGVFVIDSGFGLDDARAVVKGSLWDSGWTEYTVDVDFRMGQTAIGYTPHFAMLFNVQAITEGYDLGHYYQFHSWPDRGGLRRMEGLTTRTNTGLAGFHYDELGRPDLTIDTWYHARLVVNDSTITGYVGDLDGTYLDTPVFTFDASSILPEYDYAGPIGLKAIGGATNWYDNVTVTPEPSTIVIFGIGAFGLLVYGCWKRLQV